MQAAVVAKKIVRAIDPNDDPTAEPLSPLALVALFVATAISAFLFLRWKVQPMQDLGLHMSMAAIIADYGKEGSIYPAIYKPMDWLTTNTLFASIAGLTGRVIPAGWAFRLTFSLYLVGLPLSNLYALRTFGRSAWAAVVAVPFCYGAMYVYGFASFLFAGPLSVLCVPLFYRMLVRPTKWRVLAVAVVSTLLFFAHWHVFLWTGVLLFAMTLVAILVTSKRTLFGLPSTRPWTVAWVSLVSVLPSLGLLARWAYRSSRPPLEDELTLVRGGGASLQSFLDAVKPPSRSLADFHAMIETTRNEADAKMFVGALMTGLVCIGIARLHKWKRPPVLEIASAVTVASYFLIPEDYAGQQVIASRQIGLAMWFAPVFFSPVPGRVTRLGRIFAIAAVVSLSTFHLSYWSGLLRKFQRDEAAGFAEVIAAAPPRKKLHYVNIEPESKYFSGRSFWHVETWYMLDKQGQCDENPAYSAMQPIRYRSTYPIHRVDAHLHSWPRYDEIWDNFDLVLVHRWKPSQADLDLANQKGERIAQHGDWDLWRSKVVKEDGKFTR